MFTYNSHIHKSTNLTPYEFMFGRKAYIPNAISAIPEFKFSCDDYYSNLKLKLNRSHKIAPENLLQSREKSKLYDDGKAK